MDFPSPVSLLPVISSFGRFTSGLISVGSSPTSAGWPAADRALFVPFSLPVQYLVKKLWWVNGATAAGNVECGVYTADGTLLLTSGTTAQSGTNVIQSVTLGTAFLLHPGSFYMALVMSSTSSTVFRSGTNVRMCRLAGLAQQASANPLPATFTLATAAGAYWPLFGIARASVI